MINKSLQLFERGVIFWWNGLYDPTSYWGLIYTFRK